MISFKTRLSCVDFRLLVGFIEIAIAQSCLLFHDFHNEEEEMKMRKMAEEISKKLNEEVENNKHP